MIQRPRTPTWPGGSLNVQSNVVIAESPGGEIPPFGTKTSRPAKRKVTGQEAKPGYRIPSGDAECCCPHPQPSSPDLWVLAMAETTPHVGHQSGAHARTASWGTAPLCEHSHLAGTSRLSLRKITQPFRDARGCRMRRDTAPPVNCVSTSPPPPTVCSEPRPSIRSNAERTTWTADEASAGRQMADGANAGHRRQIRHQSKSLLQEEQGPAPSMRGVVQRNHCHQVDGGPSWGTRSIRDSGLGTQQGL